jgi:hypothetical protein
MDIGGRIMKVKELINALLKIENKESEVVYYDFEWGHLTSISDVKNCPVNSRVESMYHDEDYTLRLDDETGETIVTKSFVLLDS